MREKALVTYKGEWYTIQASSERLEGFSYGALVGPDGLIMTTFRKGGGEYFTTTDELIEEALNFLKTTSLSVMV